MTVQESDIKINTHLSSISKHFHIFDYTRDDLEREFPLPYTSPEPFNTTLIQHHIDPTPQYHTHAYSTKQERKLTCTHNHQHQHSTYVNYYVPITTPNPAHCPTCSHFIITSQYDSLDVLVTTHSHFTRRLAYLLIRELDKINLDRPASSQLNIEEYLTLINANTPSLSTVSNGTCYLHTACKSCGGTFTSVYTQVPTQRTPPAYCIWCGASSSNIYTVQENTEESCFFTLATHYNIPLPLLKHLYNLWHTDSHLTYFSQFMQLPEIKAITTRIQST